MKKEKIMALVDEACALDTEIKKKGARLSEIKEALKDYAAEKGLEKDEKGQAIISGNTGDAYITTVYPPIEIPYDEFKAFLKTAGKLSMMGQFVKVLTTEVRKYLGSDTVDRIGKIGEPDEYGRISFKRKD